MTERGSANTFARNVFFWLLELTGLPISIASALLIALAIWLPPLAAVKSTLASRAITRDKPSMETIAPVAQTPIFPAGPRKFTAENAREMSRRAAEAKKFKAQAEKARVLAMEAENAIAKPLVDVMKAISTSEASPVGTPSATYVLQRLSRVRAQLDKLDEMIAKEEDAQTLDRLASAQARLSVQEFALAGRPMPGSRRPGREKPVRGGASESPAVDE